MKRSLMLCASALVLFVTSGCCHWLHGGASAPCSPCPPCGYGGAGAYPGAYYSGSTMQAGVPGTYTTASAPIYGQAYPVTAAVPVHPLPTF